MGFGGAASAMITSLKNNNRRQTRDNFQGLGGKTSSESKCSSKPISEAQRLKIRQELKKEHRLYRIKLICGSIMAFGLIIGAFILVLK